MFLPTEVRVKTFRIPLYYIDTNVLLENTPLVKFIRNFIRDSSWVFSISSIVSQDIDDFIDIQVCLLNCTYIRWCMIETSSGLPRKSTKIFRKWSEIFGKSSKAPSSVCLHDKRNTLARRYEFYVLVARTISHVDLANRT